MKKIFTILLIFFGLTLKSKSQPNIVNENSVQYLQLKTFLIEGLKDTVGIKIALIKQVNLLDSTNNDFGVFAFRKLSSESTQYLYLRNYGEEKITIIKKYHIDSIMRYLSSYFNVNKKHIPYYLRLSCTKRVIDILSAKLTSNK